MCLFVWGVWKMSVTACRIIRVGVTRSSHALSCKRFAYNSTFFASLARYSCGRCGRRRLRRQLRRRFRRRRADAQLDQIRQRRAIAGLQPQRFPIAGHRGGRLAEQMIHGAEVHVRDRLGGSQLDGLERGDGWTEAWMDASGEINTHTHRASQNSQNFQYIKLSK